MVLLGTVLTSFDPWRSPLCTCPRKYTINPYTGCSHRCLYCYTTAYIRSRESKPKQYLNHRLRRDLKYIDPRFPVDMSLSSDPYPPEERILGITRAVLELLLPAGLRVQITTKSDALLRDIDLLSRYNVAVSVTITTLDDSLARRLEPNAPPPSNRLKALEILKDHDVPFSVRVDPVIPYLNDDENSLRELVREVASIGAEHVVTSTYKARPDNFARMVNAFPELKAKWMKLYYPGGKIKLGYAYAPIQLRRRILWPVVDEANKLKLTYATCRENLTTPKYFRAPSCDGTHLIPSRIELRSRTAERIRLENFFSNSRV
ncbi:MAG: radical SAM protein [Candidatus Korarchaeota archaeon]|nr:radical SAM protein [Thermoproteota archaeon]